jgi:hypothetical protein
MSTKPGATRANSAERSADPLNPPDRLAGGEIVERAHGGETADGARSDDTNGIVKAACQAARPTPSATADNIAATSRTTTRRSGCLLGGGGTCEGQ